jgi:hypothetical protein
MKQGSARTTDTGRKVEPSPKAVNVSAVAEIGVHQYRHNSINLYEGRGLKAPMAGTTVHHCGSQGKH